MPNGDVRIQTANLRTPLGFTYPYSVGVPLSSFLLHQDAKSHQSFEFDRQTATLVGSNSQMASLLGEGLRQASQELSDFGDEMSEHFSETNERLEDIDKSLKNIAGHLVVIESGIDRLAVAIAEGTAEVVQSLSQISAQLSELNQSASQMARMLKDSELTWALEQARTAARAMRVGDLETAETAAKRALNGGGGHVGAPTHVIFMLQLAEILIRQGPSRVSDARAALDRAEQYLALDNSEDARGRFHFARGSHYLSVAEAGGDFDNLVAAAKAFEVAITVARYSTVATMWKAIADTRRGENRAVITEALAKIILSRPWCAVEVVRLQHEGLNPSVVSEAIRAATARLFWSVGGVTSSQKIRLKAVNALSQIGELKHTKPEFFTKSQQLRNIVDTVDRFMALYNSAITTNDLSSARELFAQKTSLDSYIVTMRTNMGAN